jgi:hypothetical protein
MGGIFSNISSSMPNMSGIKSYLDPTAPPQGFSNTRAHGAVVASSGLELGRKVRNLGNVKNVKSGALAALNLSYAWDGVKRYLPKSKSKSLKKEGYKSPLATEKTMSEKIKNQAEGLAMLTTLKGRIENNVKSRQKPELPPIDPKGEFASMFGDFMRLVRLENVSRKNFIETFIEKILEIGNNNNRNELKKLRKLLEIFQKLKEIIISQSLTKT